MLNVISRILFLLLQLVLIATFCYEHFLYSPSIYGNDFWAPGVTAKVFGDSALAVVPIVVCALCSFVITPRKFPWVKSLLLLASEVYLATLVKNGGSFLGFGVLFFYLFEIVIFIAIMIDCFLTTAKALSERHASKQAS